MTPGDLRVLVQLAGLEHQARLRAVQSLRAEEARLRAALVAVEKARKFEDAEPDADLTRRRIGADIAWQALQDSRQRALQIDLARVLARREPLMATLRRSFGRETVAQTLLEQAQIADRRARQGDG